MAPTSSCGTTERSIDQQFTSERSRLSNPTALHPLTNDEVARIAILSTYMTMLLNEVASFSVIEKAEKVLETAMSAGELQSRT